MPKNLNIKKKKIMFFKFSVKVVRYGLKRVSPLLFEVKKKKVELFLDLNEATTRYRRFLRLKKSKIDPPQCECTLHSACAVKLSFLKNHRDLKNNFFFSKNLHKPSLYIKEQLQQQKIEIKVNLIFFFLQKWPKCVDLKNS